ncbi:MAG: maltose alpha-D-glucosyltransferase [bacterium]
MRETILENDPLWYKDAIIYELHVRSFFDSNDDGIGDFKGLTKKLDYLEELGVTAIWLLPFYPSPLRDDGYDISDYFDIHPGYGVLKDFKEFLKEAHRRGLRVITELVLNHTSNEHAWFQRARNAKQGSRWRDLYVWSNTPDKYKDARIIFSDFESSNWTWDSLAQAYYWHRFYFHQPDLNYDNHYIQRAIFRVVDFWFELGVDGMRLDGVPYLFEREGTNCENLPETHDFLKKLRSNIDKKFKNRMLLAEANQWPEDAAAYFGSGDECNMAFNFPLMPRMFMAIQMEDGFPIVDIFKVTPQIPDSCQWALFLRNHDELTLEMVTDEEKDYMYKVYASDPKAKINLGIRRRLAPLLSNNRKKIELMNILLFSLPGTPVIYYGDEIGMGDNYYLGDRNGVRTPMQWSPDRNAGFSRANPQKLYLPIIIDPEHHYEAVNVENQEKNLSSLLWWTRRVVDMRKGYKAFSRGSLEILSSDNPKTFAFIRHYQDESILTVVNLSRFSQVASLNLSKYDNFLPEEIFSHNIFPRIGTGSYLLTMGPFNYYSLLLREEKRSINIAAEERDLPGISLKKDWQEILQGKPKEYLEDFILLRYLRSCRWLGPKKIKILRSVNILEDVTIRVNSFVSHLLLLQISYSEGLPDTYFLPLSFIFARDRLKTLEEFPQGIISYVSIGEEEGILYDSMYNEEFHKLLLQSIVNRRTFKGEAGEFCAYPGRKLKAFLKGKQIPFSSRLIETEKGTVTIRYEDKFILKFYKNCDDGVNPELEIVKLLTEKAKFPNAFPFAGAIEYRGKGAERPTGIIAILQSYTDNLGNVWHHTIDEITRYFENILSKRGELSKPLASPCYLWKINFSNILPEIRDLIGGVSLEMASLLGKRTAEFHLALASLSEKDFAPEPFTLLYQRSRYQSIHSLVNKTFQTLKKNLGRLPENICKEAEAVLLDEENILTFVKKILQKRISAMRMRVHGDYNLNHILSTGKDFIIADFEGEPERILGERRLKYSPLKDVAAMIRSFHYAASSALIMQKSFRTEDISFLETWINPWCCYVGSIFFNSYLEALGDTLLIPKEKEELNALFQTFLLEKAVYELGYELSYRVEWAFVPINGIRGIMNDEI